MKHIVRKAYFDYEKEEKFLNDMSRQGLALTGYSWCRYVFEEVPKGAYIYRIQLLENPVEHPESVDYLRFMEETGVEMVASYGRWVYFRKKASEGEFNIYSDIESKIKHYSRIRTLFLFLILVTLLAGLNNYYYGYVVTSQGDFPINTYFAIFSFAVVALLLIFLVVPLSGKISSLQKEKEIRE